MINISAKQQATITRISDNAAAAGISPQQLQQLLTGVEFDGGLLGTSSDKVKNAFAGAAAALAAMPEAKTADQVRNDVIAGATTPKALLRLFQTVIAGKDVAGQSNDAYTKNMSIGGPAANFALLSKALVERQDTPAAHEVTLGVLTALTAQAGSGQLVISRGQLGHLLGELQAGLAGRERLTPREGAELAHASQRLVDALKTPDIRDSNGTIALAKDMKSPVWAALTSTAGWQA